MRHFIFETIWGKQISVYSNTVEEAFQILYTEFNKLARLTFVMEVEL